MAWDRVLGDLADIFSSQIRDPNEAESIAQKVGLDPANLLIFGQKPSVFWAKIVEEAEVQQKLANLIDFGKKRFPRIDFPALERQANRPTPEGPKPDDQSWQVPPAKAGGLEAIIGAQSTFLPFSFLEVGLRRGRSVALVETPRGNGTGFLTRDNLLITNNHVLPDPGVARASKVRFNYQQSEEGLALPSVTLDFDPDGPGNFATSPMEGGDDWTAVRVKGDPNATWGQLDLADATIKAEDFVNIIQHPGGLLKQIALYHNLVAYVDPGETRVQYLTDTKPGSSGSPVFDSKWRVVALHHSGGWLTQPGSKEAFFRNEGIHVRALLRGLRASGMIGT